MDNVTILQALGQADSEKVGEVVRDYLRGVCRDILFDVMTTEVSLLCGPAYHPDKSSDFCRAGSAPGYAYIESRREEVIRPRVRRRDEAGRSEEATLKSYAAVQDAGEAQRLLIEAIVAAGSMRKVGNLVNNQRGSGKSQVSQLWRQAGIEKFAELRSRRLDVDENGEPRDWLALMLDGVHLAKDLLAVVALGVTADGKKVVLDFEIGASENATVTSALVSRLVERGFKPGGNRPLLAILDGSSPLRQAVIKHFPTARNQRCLVHKARNLKRYLSKRHWHELDAYFSRLRKVQGAEAALEVVNELDAFLKSKNAAAHKSLHEAGLDLIRVHLLETPATLHVSFLSTNNIENVIKNTRRATGRVNRWRSETDQAARWLAFGMLDAEKGFKRLSHRNDLPVLINHLEKNIDIENLEKLKGKLPDWLREEALSELAKARELEDDAAAQKSRPSSTPLRTTPSASLTTNLTPITQSDNL